MFKEDKEYKFNSKEIRVFEPKTNWMDENFYKNIECKYIKIKVGSKYLNYLKKLNYDVNFGEYVNISIDHLPLGSNKYVVIKCPICDDENVLKFYNYVNVYKKGSGYRCKKCNTFENNISRKYGVENIMKLEKFRNKIKSTKLNRYNDENFNNRPKYTQTVIERYDVEHYSKTDDYKKDYKDVCIKKYNVDNVSKLETIKNKKRETYLKNIENNKVKSKKREKHKKETVKQKYGVDNVFQLDSIKKKSKNTILKKYGVENVCFLNNKKYKIRFDDRYNLYYQGTYEKDFLDFCYNNYNNIKISKPKYINYFFNDNQYKYFPDFFIDYTFNIQKEKNIFKQRYTILNGYEHIFIINKNYDIFKEKLKIIDV